MAALLCRCASYTTMVLCGRMPLDASRCWKAVPWTTLVHSSGRATAPGRCPPRASCWSVQPLDAAISRTSTTTHAGSSTASTMARVERLVVINVFLTGYQTRRPARCVRKSGCTHSPSLLLGRPPCAGAHAPSPGGDRALGHKSVVLRDLQGDTL